MHVFMNVQELETDALAKSRPTLSESPNSSGGTRTIELTKMQTISSVQLSDTD